MNNSNLNKADFIVIILSTPIKIISMIAIFISPSVVFACEDLGPDEMNRIMMEWIERADLIAEVRVIEVLETYEFEVPDGGRVDRNLFFPAKRMRVELLGQYKSKEIDVGTMFEIYLPADIEQMAQIFSAGTKTLVLLLHTDSHDWLKRDPQINSEWYLFAPDSCYGLAIHEDIIEKLKRINEV